MPVDEDELEVLGVVGVLHQVASPVDARVDELPLLQHEALLLQKLLRDLADLRALALVGRFGGGLLFEVDLAGHIGRCNGNGLRGVSD